MTTWFSMSAFPIDQPDPRHRPRPLRCDRRPRALALVSLAIATTLAACNGDDGAQCLDPLPLDCSPTFQPTYEAFYENQLRSTCSAGGTTCHGPDGAMGGLVLSDMDQAYEYLLGGVDGRARVIPGQPECSLLMQRLESDDPTFVMPVGSKLMEGERCAIRQWIANGAER